MPRPTGTTTCSCTPHPLARRHARAFTMAELLVVIGIVLVLISILIPTVAKVRETGMATDTKAMITAIDGATQMYFQDHGKWPGPLALGQLGVGVDSGVAILAGTDDFERPGGTLESVTGSENLVLGLLGGLVNTGTSAAPVIAYDPAKVGGGPVKLGGSPGGYNAYFDPRPETLSMQNAPTGKSGHFFDESGAAQDSIVPEFIDRFSSPMPFLYLRAQATGFSATLNAGMIVTVDGTAATAGESRPAYAFSEIAGYVLGNGGTYIGVGKEPDYDYDMNVAIPHGLQLTLAANSSLADLRTSKEKGSANYTYPLDLRAALVSPSAAEARQKDRYVIISAGVDRIYGTRDDLTNFGEY